MKFIIKFLKKRSTITILEETFQSLKHEININTWSMKSSFKELDETCQYLKYEIKQHKPTPIQDLAPALVPVEEITPIDHRKETDSHKNNSMHWSVN